MLNVETASPRRDDQLENLIEHWPELSQQQRREIALNTEAALRRRVWESIRETGPMSPANLAKRLELPAELVERSCRQLRACGYVQAIRMPDPFGPPDETTTYEVTQLYRDGDCQRRLRQIARDAELQQKPASAASPAASMPDPPPHRSSPTSQAAAESIRCQR